MKISHCGEGSFPANSIIDVQRSVGKLCEIVGLPVVSCAGCQQRVKCFLPGNIGLGADMLTVRIAESAHRGDEFLCFRDGARVKDRQHNNFPTVYVFRKKRQWRRLAQHNPDIELLGSRIYKLTILGKYLFCLVERKNDQTGDYFGTHGEKPEFELSDDAKVSPAAANRPEKICIFGFT